MFNQSHFADFIALRSMSQVLKQITTDDKRCCQQRLPDKKVVDTDENGGHAHDMQNGVDRMRMALAVINDEVDNWLQCLVLPVPAYDD